MHTKIIATLGPSSNKYEMMRSLAKAGVNIFRLNFSHADEKQFFTVKKQLSNIKSETGLTVKLIQDLQGPRIRIGLLSHEVEMKDGETYVFVYGKKSSIDNLEIPIDRKSLFNEVKVGHPLFLSNGAIELKVLKIANKKIYAQVERGGLLTSRKGINLPKTNLKQGGLTPKDIKDAIFGAKHGVDFIALSFVQSKADVIKLKKLLLSLKLKTMPQIIAKIERATALPLVDEIIKEADGIMVARGDLGIECPLEDLPIIQKNLIRHAHWHDKPAIVATEMLTSMMEHQRPTRAEVGDIANAIFDGADAVMLSDETAAGKYPLEAVSMMRKVIKRTDDYFNNRNYFENQEIIYKK
ncbi:MAG: pyruvate kinase [Candidatus Falkowbacteria bacterium]|nr:pyruvate kinase [Candidatus Falkowbacteria bacterium]